NSGTIAATTVGILVLNVQTFTGGLTNSGTISGTPIVGLGVATVSTFTGGIVNQAGGTISAQMDAVLVDNISTFAGGITNAGTLTGQTGVMVEHVANFSGTISNSGSISGTIGGAIALFTSTVAGQIVDSGVLSGGIRVDATSRITSAA